MVFHRTRLRSANCHDLVIDNASITGVNYAKYLEIIIDVKFNLSAHITLLKTTFLKLLVFCIKQDSI